MIETNIRPKRVWDEDILAQALEHYETRADRRPKQVWDEENKAWMKIPNSIEPTD